MNAVTRESDSNAPKAKSGNGRKPKQAASATGKTKKKAAKNRKSVSANGQSTGKKPVRKKAAGKKRTTVKKAAGRKKPTATRKPATRATGASGGKPTATTGRARLDALPIDPPPVTFPDAEAAAGDPKSLSWMAQQAVSALNAVKAHQAEKGKIIRARVEKDKPEREPRTGSTVPVTGAASGEGVPVTVVGNAVEPLAAPGDAGNSEPVDTGQQPAQATGKFSTGHPGKDVGADTGTPPDAIVQKTGKPESPGRANDATPMAASVPLPGNRDVAGHLPAAPARRRYPSRLQAVVAVAIVVPLWLYYGGGEQAVHVTTQTEQDMAGKPVPAPAAPPVTVDEPVWQPATTPTQFPEPVPVSQVPPSHHSLDTAKPVTASGPNGVAAVNNGQPAAEPVVSPGRQPGSGLAGTVPARPGTPPGYRAPGYGYYPRQPAWQPSPSYRPGYSWPPTR